MPTDYDDGSNESMQSYRDCRNNEMLPIGSEPSVDISTQLMNQRIQRTHCMLLERATKGRLTWQGDQIVSTTQRLRERESAVALIRKEIQKLEAKASQNDSPQTRSPIRESRARCSVRQDGSPRQATSARSRSDACISDCPVEQH